MCYKCIYLFKGFCDIFFLFNLSQYALNFSFHTNIFYMFLKWHIRVACRCFFLLLPILRGHVTIRRYKEDTEVWNDTYPFPTLFFWPLQTFFVLCYHEQCPDRAILIGWKTDVQLDDLIRPIQHVPPGKDLQWNLWKPLKMRELEWQEKD